MTRTPAIRRFTALPPGLLLAAALLSACATHPATHPAARPSVPGPSDADIGVGERAFPYARQAAGGEFTADPALSAYVARVGRKVAAASDHPDLPYDFVVIDNPAPDAWALPGGKVGIHRGLLTELDSEAELAAVLARAVVRAGAARDARRLERELWSGLGSTGVAADAAGGRRDLIVGDARLGAVLARAAYGPDDAAAADRDGMAIMAKAGYDPGAAVRLQEALLRLAGTGTPDGPSGLLAAEPPSPKRLAAAQEVLRTLPKGGATGAEAYRAAIAPLTALAPAYARLAEGERALARGDADGALAAARDAAARVPAEPRFRVLEGRALLAQDRLGEALTALNEAVRRGSGHYLPWLVRGEARQAVGETAGARDDLLRSLALLPTDTAHLHLGILDLAEGRADAGKRHLRAAQEAGGAAGTEAREAMARMEMLDVPGRYVSVGVGLTPEGFMFFTVVNRAPFPVRDVRVRVDLVDPATGAPRGADFSFDGPFAPDEPVRRETRFGPFGPEVTLSVRTDVVGARLAE